MSKKVLLVDDEAGFTKLLKMNLEKDGEYEVRIENDSTKALAAAREFQPDCAVLDIVMPGLDGGDVAAQFSANTQLQNMPIIMLTALVAQGEVPEGAVAQAGSTSVLAKPVNIGVLKQAIFDAIEESKG